MKTTIQNLTKYPKVIKLFLDYPYRNLTPLEISKITKIPYATVWRYVKNLESAGIIFIEKIGEYNVCRLNRESPLIGEFKAFLKLQLSPHWLAVDEFLRHAKSLYDVQKIILFGSVARGNEELTSDIDIVVLTGKKSKKLEDKISDVVGRIAEKSKMVIIPLILTRNELKENKQFSKELEKGRVLYERNK